MSAVDKFVSKLAVVAIKCAQAKEPVSYGGIAAEILGDVPLAIPLNVATAGMGNAVARGAGSIGAALTETRSDEEQRAQRGNRRWANLIPGVGPYNGWKRLGRTAKDYEEFDGKRPGARQKSNLKHEYIGNIVSSLVPAAVGAGIGAAVAPRSEATRGAALGALAGGAVSASAILAANLSALIKKRRQTADQMEYEQNASPLAQYLVPGMGEYNMLKRIGYSAKYDARPTSDKKQV